MARWPAGFPGDAASCAICVDFDGTLAPVVDDPAEAEALDGAAELLASLARRYGRVAVISGRPASFLLDRLGSSCVSAGVFLAGLYGMEQVDPFGSVVRSPDAARSEGAIAALARQAAEQAPRGVEVEPKGLSVTLHWRRAEDRALAERWAESFALAAAERDGLEAQGGRMSVEIRPRGGGDKGSVLERLAGGMSSVAFAGDDRGDLPAFDALDRLEEKGILAVRVAVASAESPEELIARADVVVDGPAQAMELLAELL